MRWAPIAAPSSRAVMACQGRFAVSLMAVTLSRSAQAGQYAGRPRSWRMAKSRRPAARPKGGSPMRSARTADLLIVGGGIIGVTLGVAVARAGLRVVLVEREDPAR